MAFLARAIDLDAALILPGVSLRPPAQDSLSRNQPASPAAMHFLGVCGDGVCGGRLHEGARLRPLSAESGRRQNDQEIKQPSAASSMWPPSRHIFMRASQDQ